MTVLAAVSVACTAPIPDCGGAPVDATNNAVAAPVAAVQPAPATGAAPAITLTEAQLLQIAPDAKSCDGATAECRTAAQAAPLLNAAHATFGISTKGEIAALVSLQAFESGSFRFQTNQAGNPGQGTRNLMNFPFIYAYALDTPVKKDTALQLVPQGTDLSSVSADVKNQVRALVLDDDLDFASAAWFLTRSKDLTQTACDQSIRDGLIAATEAGWEDFITKCVGTTVTDERRRIYQAALTALN